MNIQCSGGSRSFAKKMRALELRSAMVSHWKLTMTNWEQSSKLTLLTQEVGKELNINHFMVIQDLKQIGKVNKLDKWIPHELTANQKLSFWSVLFYVTTAKLFLIGLWCVMKIDFIQQPAMTSSVAGLRRISRALSQSQTCPQQKVMVTVCGLLPGWSTRAFWILEKPDRKSVV